MYHTSIYDDVTRGDYQLAGEYLIRDEDLLVAWKQSDAIRDFSRYITARFDISNVAEYMYAETPQEEFLWQRDFPNVAPPFASFWLEYKRASHIMSEDYGEVSNHHFPDRVAGCFMAVDFQAEENNGDLMLSMLDPESRALLEGWRDSGEMRWLWLAQIFVKWDGLSTGPFVSVFGAIKPDGSFHVPPSFHAPVHFADVDRNVMIDSAMTLVFPMALSLSFLHCKNVVAVDALDKRSRQQRRCDERRKVPYTVFKELVIDPMKKTLAREGNAETTGLSRALHICRGHFAHYNDDKPLFGKYVGDFWIPSHVRGSRDVGVVEKTYRLKGGHRERATTAVK